MRRRNIGALLLLGVLVGIAAALVVYIVQNSGRTDIPHLPAQNITHYHSVMQWDFDTDTNTLSMSTIERGPVEIVNPVMGETFTGRLEFSIDDDGSACVSSTLQGDGRVLMSLVDDKLCGNPRR